MKKLIIIRHAKSSWDDPYLEDHQRPLAQRGLRDSPRMGQRLKRRNIVPDKMISSDAARAKATALIIAEQLHFPKENIEFTRKLYHTSAYLILDLIKKTGDDIDALFIFGHIPGFNDLINLLGGKIDNLPTCGQYAFTFDTDSWSQISKKNAITWFLDYPKKEN
ncbi:phosphohistidine phosphatase SixA [Belliella baltica DSM 15883]|uniref:Phosphohistidine phosphatase SixA n=1 Tax=Belliella baltica (strain DSM 15883 / CIP 108006 / LMG 21964 / BA134) TaxID=866536 RepID=I3ZAH5_BELBD|nr:histidine phosphatase family protein [Belliella baltica]AFL86243.1 phosphohistidine phosphatase SixA [Belliella baltica DSM 15883]